MGRSKGEWELADAFATARYWLPAANSGVALTFASSVSDDGQSARLEELLPRGPWAIVSAANPWSVELSAEENEIRAATLQRELAKRGVELEPMHNDAAEGGCEEASCLVDNVSREFVLELCWKFGQAAAVWGIGTRCGLLWTRSERWTVLPPRLIHV